jgi:RND family efflux transporter MFP subunit
VTSSSLQFRSLLVAATASAIVAACSGPAPEPVVPDGAAPVSVTTALAAPATLADRFEAGGVVAASATATLGSRLIAPVVEVRVRAGDPVRAGAVLITLDAGDTAARARQADAGLAAAEQGLTAAMTEREAAAAERTLATAWHARLSTLHQRRSATSQELDEAEARRAAAAARADGAEARVGQASAQVAAARAAAEAAGATSGFAAITAPFDGVVTERLVDPGTLAAPGVPLLRLDARGAGRVDVRVDEARVNDIQVGDRVEVLIGDGAIEATVGEIARAVDATQRSFTVKVGLPAGAAPRTGSFARVRFRGREREALTVPASAVRRQGQLTSVFVVAEGTARLRLVQVAEQEGDRVEVVSGLDAGEAVIVDAPAGLSDGQRVAEARR